MSTLSRRRMAASAVLALVVTSASCDQSPVRPLPPDLVGLTVTAPTEIAPSGFAQLEVQAQQSDGSVENVTHQAEWSVDSVPAAALTLTASGYAAAREPGRATVRVRFSGVAAVATILVVPPGTFRVAGSVRACGVSGMSNATVSVISGLGAGVAVQTDSNGGYELYGLAGPVTIRAAREDFITVTREIVVTAHAEVVFAMHDVFGGGAGCWDY